MLKSIVDRRSVRSYLPQPVPEDQLLRLIESARIAPSGSNTQPWRFIVIREASQRAAVTRACHDQKWMLEAPVHIACVADLGSRIEDSRGIVLTESSPEPEVKLIIRDTAIATEHLVLQAQEEGLPTCWVAWFTQDQIRSVLGVPPHTYVVAVITVGYSEERPSPRPRHRMDEILRYERW